MGTRCTRCLYTWRFQLILNTQKCIIFYKKFFFLIDNWQEKQYPLQRDQYGKWTITIPPLADGSPAVKHGQAIKVDLKIKPIFMFTKNSFSPLVIS